MAAACIVLNGPSCSGKSSIAAALQERWPRPLQSTGIDTFLASQSDRFFAIDGTLTDGISWVPTTVDGMPAYDIVPGESKTAKYRGRNKTIVWRHGLDPIVRSDRRPATKPSEPR